MQRFTTQDLFEAHASTPAPEPQVQASTTANFRRTTAEATPSVKPASDKSVAFLRKLVAERKPDTDPAFVEQVISEGQARVSKAIDNLLDMPMAEREVPFQAPEQRTNRYEALCEDCRVMVPEGEGILIRSDEGRWEVYHRDGECQRTDFPFPYGRYAVEGEDGTLKFYAATVTGLYVQASDELHSLPANAVEGIVAKIEADPLAASQAYGREFRQCGKCGRGLTDENSRAMGIGPVCRTRF